MADVDLLGRAILWGSLQIFGLSATRFALAHRIHLLSKFLTDSFLKDEERETKEQDNECQKNQ
jgi:hypothetical protein